MGTERTRLQAIGGTPGTYLVRSPWGHEAGLLLYAISNGTGGTATATINLSDASAPNQLANPFPAGTWVLAANSSQQLGPIPTPAGTFFNFVVSGAGVTGCLLMYQWERELPSPDSVTQGQRTLEATKALIKACGHAEGEDCGCHKTTSATAVAPARLSLSQALRTLHATPSKPR